MYAVIKTGGKQYRVHEGDVLRVEKLEGEPGDRVHFDDVLMIGTADGIRLGKDAADATVSAVITGQGKSRKIVVFKKRRRKNYVRTMGHRQPYTAIRIDRISAAGEGAVEAVKAEAASRE
jgi:large subunit ribosomal protein L21